MRLFEILREGGDVAESRGSLWFKVGNLNSISVRMLPKGINQHFDIAFVVHNLASQNGMSFHLALVPPLFLDKPQLGGSWADLKKQMETDTTNMLDVGRKYTLRIVAYGSNAEAVYYNFSIRLIPKPIEDTQTGKEMSAPSLRSLLIVEQL